MRSLYYLSLVVISMMACDSTNDTKPQLPQLILDQSLEIFSGTIINSGLEEEEGSEFWEIKIENDEGAIVNFYWTVVGQELRKIEGDQGPFNYDLWPGDRFINFSTAKTVAIGGVKNSNITSWELAQEEEFNDLWVYTFRFDLQKVYVDAENGNILQID